MDDSCDAPLIGWGFYGPMAQLLSPYLYIKTLRHVYSNRYPRNNHSGLLIVGCKQAYSYGPYCEEYSICCNSTGIGFMVAAGVRDTGNLVCCSYSVDATRQTSSYYSNAPIHHRVRAAIQYVNCFESNNHMDYCGLRADRHHILFRMVSYR